MHVRMANRKDAAAVLAVYAPYCSTPITFELEPPDLEDIEERIATTLQKYPWLVMIDGHDVVGYAYAHGFRDRAAYRWSVETSVYVAQTHHKKGVASSLYEILLTMLKAQGFVSAIAGVTLPNEASVILHRKFGFQPAGEFKKVGFKSGAWHAVGFFELELNPASPTPAEPLGLDAVTELLSNLPEKDVRFS